MTGAALLMTASVMGTGNVANAKHRRYRYRTHRVYRRHACRHYRRTRKHYRRRARIRRRRSHSKYVWMLNGNKTYEAQIIGHDNNGEPRVKFLNKAQRRTFGMIYVPTSSLYATKVAAIHADKAHNKVSRHHKIYRSKSHKRNHLNNAVQMQKETIEDINHDREANGVRPLQETQELDQIAAIRAKQVSKNGDHTDSNTGKYYFIEDANKLGYSNINDTNSAENLADSFLGKIEASPSEMPAIYNKNGKDMADNINKALMNYDTSSNLTTNWGHKKNILDSSWNSVGVGVAKYPSQGETSYMLTEEFSD